MVQATMVINPLKLYSGRPLVESSSEEDVECREMFGLPKTQLYMSDKTTKKNCIYFSVMQIGTLNNPLDVMESLLCITTIDGAKQQVTAKDFLVMNTVKKRGRPKKAK